MSKDQGTSPENTEASCRLSSLQGSASIEPSQENAMPMYDEWTPPWSNTLLRQRIEDREKEPGCGGGLANRM